MSESNGSIPSDATVTHPTPYSGNTTLGRVGVGNYGTTSEQLDTSGGNAYGEGAASGPPSQWQNGGLADDQFIALTPQGK